MNEKMWRIKETWGRDSSNVRIFIEYSDETVRCFRMEGEKYPYLCYIIDEAIEEMEGVDREDKLEIALERGATLKWRPMEELPLDIENSQTFKERMKDVIPEDKYEEWFKEADEEELEEYNELREEYPCTHMVFYDE